MVQPRVPLGSELSDKASAKAYTLMMSTFSFGYTFFARKIIKRTLKEEGRLLDVATGPGFLLIKFARVAPKWEITGLDISEPLLSIARRKIAANKLEDRIRLVLGSAYEMPFEDNYFDVIVCTNALHNLDDPSAFLSECYRVLKIGGKAVVFAYRRDAWAPFRWMFDLQSSVLRLFRVPMSGMGGVIRASYLSDEIKEILANIPFSGQEVKQNALSLSLALNK